MTTKEAKSTLEAVIFTLRGVKTDDENDNWTKLVACRNSLFQVLDYVNSQLNEEPVEASD